MKLSIYDFLINKKLMHKNYGCYDFLSIYIKINKYDIKLWLNDLIKSVCILIHNRFN